MDRRDANIDLVFRNGLKDFEVLPPPDVWEKVSSRTERKRIYFSVLKYAASLLIIASASYMTYRIGLNQSNESIPSSLLMAEQITLERHALREIPAVVRPNDPERTVFIDNTNSETAVNLTYSDLIAEYNNEADPARSNDLNYDNSDKPEVTDPYLPYSDILLYDDYNSLAGSSVKPNGVGERWSITALISPTFVSSFSSGGNEVARQITAEDKPAMSYTGGVAFTYQISKRLSFQSGFYYSTLGQNLSGVSAYGGFSRYDLTKGDHNFEVLTGSGTIYTNNSDVFLSDRTNPERIITRYNSDVFDPRKAELAYVSSSIKQSFSYLELPMVIRYKIIDKRLDLNVSGGISSNLLVGNSVFTSENGKRMEIGKTEGAGFLTLSSSVGMGMEYSLTENLSFNLEPTLKYYINAFNEPAGMNIHPYSFGIFSGISWKF